MKSIVVMVGALAGALAASQAVAEQAPGLYVAGGVGYNWKSDQEVKSDATIGSTGQKYVYDLSTKDALAGFARLGWRYNDHFRVELEGAYRPGDINAAHGPEKRNYGNGLKDDAICGTVSSTVCSSPSGKIDQTTLFVNAIYDFYPEYSLHPYIGAGIGLDYVNGKVDGRMAQVSQSISLKGSKVVPAAQFLLGVSAALSERLSLDLGYQLTYVGKVKYNSTVAALSGANGADFKPGAFEGDFNDQVLLVGLRYALGAKAAPAPAPAPYTPPPAPQPPAPTPAPEPQPVAPAAPTAEARQFTVYFQFDRYALTQEAKAVVKSAADYAVSNNSHKVTVVGYTDTSGSAAYNIKLSQRRAGSTAKALVANGVADADISVSWKGETDLAVPTADGVREPRNRRATIDIQF